MSYEVSHFSATKMAGDLVSHSMAFATVLILPDKGLLVFQFQIRSLFAQFGDIVEVVMLKDKRTGYQQGTSIASGHTPALVSSLAYMKCTKSQVLFFGFLFRIHVEL